MFCPLHASSSPAQEKPGRNMRQIEMSIDGSIKGQLVFSRSFQMIVNRLAFACLRLAEPLNTNHMGSNNM